MAAAELVGLSAQVRAAGEIPELGFPLERLEGERTATIRELERLSAEIFERRRTAMSLLGRRSGLAIVLERGGHRVPFAAALRRFVDGEVALKLALRFTPGELLELVEDADDARLAKELDVPRASARAWIRSFDERRFGLEGLVLDEKVAIKLGSRDLSACSPGEVVAALLPAAIAPGEGPLLLDRPEVSLDTSTVLGTLVPLLEAVSLSRQVVVATKNLDVALAANQVVFLDGGERGSPVELCHELEELLDPNRRERREELERSIDQESWGKTWSPEDDEADAL